jgi:hypothetical protein
MKKISTALIALPLIMLLPLTTSAKEGGTQTTADTLVTSATSWKVLSSKTINISLKAGTPDSPRACGMNGSADAKIPAGKSSSQYRFVMSLDNTNPAVDGACERTLSLNTLATTAQIGSACYAPDVPAGPHTIYFLARKVTAAAPNITVTDNSFTISCADNPL